MKFLPILFAVFLYSCSEKKKAAIQEVKDLPKVIKVEKLKATDMIVTMSNNIAGSKNYIYAPTMLFCWNEIREQLKEISLASNDTNSDIALLNSSNDFLHSLEEGEYKTTVDVGDVEIKARAEFNIELTFDPFLEKFEFPLSFKNEYVAGFGMHEWNNSIAALCRIVYYKDDDNFIFKLMPKGNKDELIFIKGFNTEKANHFNEVLKVYKDKQKIATKEMVNKNLESNYQLEDGETFEIPELKFNIEKDYSSLSGQTIFGQETIHSKVVPYHITRAWQRNALILNNKGAKIESEAEMEVAAAAEPPTEEVVKIIQHLNLNSTFFLIIKHTNQSNPYFMVKVDNAELMTPKE